MRFPVSCQNDRSAKNLSAISKHPSSTSDPENTIHLHHRANAAITLFIPTVTSKARFRDSLDGFLDGRPGGRGRKGPVDGRGEGRGGHFAVDGVECYDVAGKISKYDRGVLMIAEVNFHNVNRIQIRLLLLL